MNNFISIILKSKTVLGSILVLGVVNSIMNVGLLLFVNEALDNNYFIPYLEGHPYIAFLLLLLGSFAINLVFQRKIIGYTNKLLYNFETSFLSRIKDCSLENFEKFGKDKIYTHINDIRSVASIPSLFVNSFNALIIVICCMFYFFTISIRGGLIIIGILLLLLIIYLFRNKIIENELHEIRDLQNSYYQYLEDALNGFTEIKVNETIRTNLYDKYLYQNRLANKQLSISSGMKFLTNELIGNYSWYLLIGIILFLLPVVVEMSKASLIGYVVIILYLISPVATLITLIPSVMSIKIAMSRLTNFDNEMSKNLIENKKANESFISFETLRLEDIVYSYYPDESEMEFTLGPINLEFKKNEIVFITGGNGSGKSTLMKVMLGLHKPNKGKLYINGKEIRDGIGISALASAIFASPHIFSENYNDFDFSISNKQLVAYINIMQLREVVKIQEEHYLVNNKLSKGQQKRIAMILALLEDKEIILMDEWAAEQDKVFRTFFYEQFLQDWKDKGKTIILITHDNQYYGLADRIIRLDLGKVQTDNYSKRITNPLNIN